MSGSVANPFRLSLVHSYEPSLVIVGPHVAHIVHFCLFPPRIEIGAERIEAYTWHCGEARIRDHVSRISAE